MNAYDSQWKRLTAAARRTPDDRALAAPYGFATRVAALAMQPRRSLASVFDRFAFRAVGVACLLALLSAAVNYPVFASADEPDDDLALVTEDPAAMLLEISS